MMTDERFRDRKAEHNQISSKSAWISLRTALWPADTRCSFLMTDMHWRQSASRTASTGAGASTDNNWSINKNENYSLYSWQIDWWNWERTQLSTYRRYPYVRVLYDYADICTSWKTHLVCATDRYALLKQLVKQVEANDTVRENLLAQVAQQRHQLLRTVPSNNSNGWAADSR